MAVSTKKSRVVISIALLLIVFGFSQAMAQTTYYSQGAVNFTSVTNWNDAQDGTGNPAPGTSVFTSGNDDFVVQNSDNLTIDAAPTVNNLTINTSGTVTNNGFDLAMNATLGITQGTVSMGSNSVSAQTVNVNGGTFNAGSSSHSFFLTLSSGTFNAETSTIDMSATGSTTVFNKSGGTFNEGTATFNIVPYSLGSNATLTITSNTNISFENLVHDGVRLMGTSNVFEISFGGTVTYNIKNSFERTGRASAINFPSGATLSYDPGAELNYSAGTISFTVGNEWPSSNSPDSVIVTATTANGVTLNSSRLIPSTGALVLSQTSSNFVVGDGTILTINGVLERKVSGTTGISLSGTGTVQYAATGSSLNYNTSANTTIGAEWPATNSPENVEITILNSNALSSSGALSRTVTKNLTMNVGTVNLNAGTLTVLGNVAGSEIAGSAIINDATTLEIGNSGSGNSQSQVITGTITLNKMTVNKTGGANDAANTVQLTGTAALTFTSGSSLTLTAGILDLNGGSRFGSSPTTLTISSGAVLKTGGTSLTSVTTLTATNGKIVFSGSSQEILPTGITIGTLELNNASGGAATSAGTLTVGSSLVLTSGKLTTTSENVLRLAATASVSGTPSSSNMVVGPLQKEFTTTGSFSFPIGSGSSYAPATFNYTIGTFGGTSIIELQHTTGAFSTGTLPSGISEIGTQSHYILKEVGTAPTGITYSFTGTFEDGNFSPETRNRVLVQDSATPTWTVGTTDPGTDINTTANTVLATGFNALPTNSFFVAFGAGGTMITWDGGAGDGSWGSATNWDIDALPTSEDDVTIDGTVSVNIDGTTSASALTLTLGDGTNLATLNVGGSSTSPLTIYGTGADALTVDSNSKLEVNNSNGIKFGAGGSYDNTRTDFTTGTSTVEYILGVVQIDSYHHLNINGSANSGTGGTITVNGNLTKTSSTGFTASDSVSVTGTYTNTLGNATYNSGFNVSGTPFTVTAGTVSGSLHIKSATTTVNGGAFGGTVNFDGGAAQTLNGSASAVFGNLTMNNAAGLTLSTSAQANGTITFTDGLITTTAANLLTFGSGATVGVGNDNSYVNGPLSRINAIGSAVLYPIGKSSYRPVSTNLNGSTPTVRFEVFDSSPNQSYEDPIMRISIVRYWRGQVTTGSISSGSVTLHYGPDDGVSNFDAQGDVVVARSSDNSTDTYKSLGGQETGTPGTGTVASTVSVGSSLNYFTLGTVTGDNSLPVELSSFEAVSAFNQVVLKWNTQSELENLGFNVYRARTAEPENWKLLNETMIPGQGTYTHATDYEYVDRNVAAGEAYLYKLESVSVSGLRVDERTIEVAVPIPDQYALFKNYPNPFNPTTNIRFQLPDAQNVKLAVYDIRGSLVKTVVNNQTFPAGEHTVTWDATDNNGSRVASGMYIYRFEAGKFSKIDKMILLK